MSPEAQTTPCPHCGKHYTSITRICPDDGSVIEHASPLVGQVGAVLDGKYRLDGFLSHGGMGAVYRATHVMLGKTVAVKLINPELVTSAEIVRRFQREARAATTLNHVNIVSVYDLGQTSDGTLYIAMEFIDGPSLKAAIQQSHGLSPDRAIAVLRQVASALSLAHRNGIIHRDLKPHNIMLARDSEGREVAKLVDFGIAKTFDEGTKLTSTGLPIGTPHYMPPEQASGGVVDARSDLYSVGVILYEMLTGNVPFDGDSTPVILIKHIKEPPIAPSLKRSGGVPPALDAIALRLLQKDPANRFQSAEELAAALDQATTGVTAGSATHVMASPLAATPPTSRPTATSTDVAPTVLAPQRTPARPPTTATVPVSAASTVPAPEHRPSPVAAAPAPTTQPQPVVPAHSPAQAEATVVVPLAASAAPPATVAAAAPPMAGPTIPPPPPSPVAAAQPAARSSSVVVLSVLGLGIIAALGAAYYLNTLAGRTGPTGVVTKEADKSAPGTQGAPPPDRPPDTSSVATSGSSAVQQPVSPPVTPPDATGRAEKPPSNDPVRPPSGGGAAGGQSPPPIGGSERGVAGGQTASGRSNAVGETGGRRASTTTGATTGTTAGATTGRSGAGSTSSTTAGVGGGATQVTRREEAVQPPSGFPEKPAVYFRCAGPSEVCNPLRSAVDDALENAGMTSVRRSNIADVDVSAQVEVVQQNVDRQFGQTFATRSYSVSLSGETTKTGEVVTMPNVENFSFDQRVGSERAVERSRLISAAVVDRVKEFAARKRAR